MSTALYAGMNDGMILDKHFAALLEELFDKAKPTFRPPLQLQSTRQEKLAYLYNKDSPEEILAPYSSPAVLVATEMFRIPNQETVDFGSKLLVPMDPKLEEGESFTVPLSSKMSAIFWNHKQNCFVSGLALMPAFFNEDVIAEFIPKANAQNKVIMAIMNTDRSSESSEDPETIPEGEWLVHIEECPLTKQPHVAWVNKSFEIDVASYNKDMKPHWSFSQCEACLKEIEKAVRCNGYDSTFAKGSTILPTEELIATRRLLEDFERIRLQRAEMEEAEEAEQLVGILGGTYKKTEMDYAMEWLYGRQYFVEICWTIQRIEAEMREQAVKDAAKEEEEEATSDEESESSEEETSDEESESSEGSEDENEEEDQQEEEEDSEAFDVSEYPEMDFESKPRVQRTGPCLVYPPGIEKFLNPSGKGHEAEDPKEPSEAFKSPDSEEESEYEDEEEISEDSAESEGDQEEEENDILKDNTHFETWYSKHMQQFHSKKEPKETQTEDREDSIEEVFEDSDFELEEEEEQESDDDEKNKGTQTEIPKVSVQVKYDYDTDDCDELTEAEVAAMGISPLNQENTEDQEDSDEEEQEDEEEGRSAEDRMSLLSSALEVFQIPRCVLLAAGLLPPAEDFEENGEEKGPDSEDHDYTEAEIEALLSRGRDHANESKLNIRIPLLKDFEENRDEEKKEEDTEDQEDSDGEDESDSEYIEEDYTEAELEEALRKRKDMEENKDQEDSDSDSDEEGEQASKSETEKEDSDSYENEMKEIKNILTKAEKPYVVNKNIADAMYALEDFEGYDDPTKDKVKGPDVARIQRMVKTIHDWGYGQNQAPSSSATAPESDASTADSTPRFNSIEEILSKVKVMREARGY